MTEQPEVKIVSDTGIRDQFGQGVIYGNGTVSSKKMALIFGIPLLLAVIPVVLSGPPDPDKPVKSLLSFEGDIKPSEEIQFPQHQEGQVAQSGQVTGQLVRRGKPEVFKGPQLLNRPRNVKIPPGVMVKAVLLSGASNGLVRAQLKEPVTLNGETLIEQEALLIGQGQSTEERLFIRFSKIVLRDGQTDTIQAQAADLEDKIPGLHGSLLGNHALKVASSMGLYFLSGVSAGFIDTDVKQGAEVHKPSVKNAMLQGAAKAASEEGQEVLSSSKNKTPIIEVPSGTEIYVMFEDS